MNDVLFIRVLNGFEDLQVGQPFCIYPCIVETRDMRVLETGQDIALAREARLGEAVARDRTSGKNTDDHHFGIRQ